MPRWPQQAPHWHAGSSLPSTLAQRERSDVQSWPHRCVFKNTPMDLHFLKIKSECLGLTSKNFRYRTPAYFSSLICSYSRDTTCGVPHPTDAGQPLKRPASRPPPSEQDLLSAGEGCPLLACGTPLIPQLSSGLPGLSFPDGQPRWGVSSGPPHPPLSHITLALESSLPFELPRPDSAKSRKNSQLSQKHVEEGNHEQSKVFPPDCRQKNVPGSDVQRAVRGSDERAHTLWEACVLSSQGQVWGRSKVPGFLGSVGSLSRREEAVPGKQEGPKEQ